MIPIRNVYLGAEIAMVRRLPRTASRLLGAPLVPVSRSAGVPKLIAQVDTGRRRETK
jgi:hypothetical protein